MGESRYPMRLKITAELSSDIRTSIYLTTMRETTTALREFHKEESAGTYLRVTRTVNLIWNMGWHNKMHVTLAPTKRTAHGRRGGHTIMQGGATTL